MVLFQTIATNLTAVFLTVTPRCTMDLEHSAGQYQNKLSPCSDRHRDAPSVPGRSKVSPDRCEYLLSKVDRSYTTPANAHVHLYQTGGAGETGGDYL